MKKRNRIYIGVALALLCIFILVSLQIGRYSLNVFDVLRGQASKMETNVFFQLRLPRTCVAIIAGAILAYVGSILQTIFKNPLASPEIIGMASGASSGAAVAIVLFGGGFTITMISAFCGGILAVIMAIVLATRSNQRRLASFVLSGIVVNAIAQSITMIMKLVADPERQLGSIEFWMMGGLSSITQEKLLYLLPFALVSMLALWLCSSQIELLALNDEDAQSLGVNVKWIRPIVLLLCTLGVASVISVIGLVSFVGLISPHLARLLTKRNTRSTWVLSALIGANVLLVADIFARNLFTIELPISIVTSLIGAPLLFIFMIRKDKLL